MFPHRITRRFSPPAVTQDSTHPNTIQRSSPSPSPPSPLRSVSPWGIWSCCTAAPPPLSSPKEEMVVIDVIKPSQTSSLVLSPPLPQQVTTPQPMPSTSVPAEMLDITSLIPLLETQGLSNEDAVRYANILSCHPAIVTNEIMETKNLQQQFPEIVSRIHAHAICAALQQYHANKSSSSSHVTTQQSPSEMTRKTVHPPFTETNEPKLILKGHVDCVRAMTFGRQRTAHLIFTVSNDSEVGVFNVNTGSLERMLKGHTNSLLCVCVSPDDDPSYPDEDDSHSLLATSGLDRHIVIWSTRTFEKKRTLKRETSQWYRCLCFSPTSEYLLSGELSGHVTLWKVSNGAMLRSWQAHIITDRNSAEVMCVSFLPPTMKFGFGVVSCGADKLIKCWNMDQNRDGDPVPILSIEAHAREARVVVAFDQCRRLVSASYDSSIRIWDTDDGSPCAQLTNVHGTGQFGTICMSLFLNESFLVSGGGDNSICLLSITPNSLALLHRIVDAHSNWIVGISVNDDGTQIATCSYDRTVRVWSVYANG